MEPLKKVQVEGCLMFTEPQELFGNLDELCYVSTVYTLYGAISNWMIHGWLETVV